MNVIKKYSGIGGGLQTPNRLIIHSMSEIIQGMHASDYLKEIAGLSVHFMILPDGKVMKLRKTHQIAYHALGHNTNTVGIEVLVEGEHTYDEFIDKIAKDWCNEAQMDSLVELSNGIIEYYDIKTDDVVRHSDIDPVRKSDPGQGFDWDVYKGRLRPKVQLTTNESREAFKKMTGPMG
eukprot:m.347412 g.347412  ORF g.347412 m.347412 type:complete len:178 (-) comp32649_c0_seq1:135-668(-)